MLLFSHENVKVQYMSVGKVSFGTVYAVSGRENRINNLNRMLNGPTRQGKIKIEDVTGNYRNAATNGKMAQAAQRGDRVSVYITGPDVHKVITRQPAWDTIGGILANMAAYYDVNRQPVGSVARVILAG